MRTQKLKKHFISATLAVVLSTILTPALLSLGWSIFANGSANQIVVVPSRNWELLRQASTAAEMGQSSDPALDLRPTAESVRTTVSLLTHELDWPSVDDSRCDATKDDGLECASTPQAVLARGRLRLGLVASRNSLEPPESLESLESPRFSIKVALRHPRNLERAGPDTVGDSIARVGSARLASTFSVDAFPVDAGWVSVGLRSAEVAVPNAFEVYYIGDTGITTKVALASHSPALERGTTAAWLHVPTSGTLQVRSLTPSSSDGAAFSVQNRRWWDLAFALTIVFEWWVGTIVYLWLVGVIYLFSLSMIERLPERLRPIVTTEIRLVLRVVRIGGVGTYGLWTLTNLWMFGKQLVSVAAG
jgi:hypothetical protein